MANDVLRGAISVQVCRAGVVQSARSWIGTPYHHQASRRGLGTDCLGLVRGIFRELYDREAEEPPAYSPDWGEAAGRETLIEAAARHLIRRETSTPDPGDIVVFRMRRGAIAKHVGVMTSAASMVHAQQSVGVIEVGFGANWQRRVVGVYCFPGILN